MVAGEAQERRVAEALVADLQCVLQRPVAEFLRQQANERRHVLAVELLGPGELPEQRPELVAEPVDAGAEEALDRLPRFAQHPAG